MATPNPKKSALACMVDELGQVEAALEPHRRLIAREDELRKIIRGHYEGAPAGEPYEVLGEKYTVLLGAKAQVKTVNIAKLVKAIGTKAFIAFASVTIANVEKHAPGLDCVTSERTGSRSVKVFRRADLFG
jgi:hypothetical protein